MNILLTGGAGYIGSVVAEELIKQNYCVIIIDNLQEGNKEAILPEAIFYEGDFENDELLSEIFNKYEIDVVFHFAAETTIKFSMTDPEIYFYNNVVKGLNLLSTMRKFGCDKIIFSSTAAIFGEPQYIPIDEDHRKIPINSYGQSKLIFENILEWYHKAYGLKYNTFRYFNAAGASDRLGENHKNESHLIPIVIKSILDNSKTNKFEIFGNNYSTKDGTCVRDYIHVIDIANAHILSIKNLEKNPRAKYNLGNGEGFSVLEVIETIKDISGENVKFSFGNKRPGDPAILISSYKKAKEELGWEPKYSILDGIIQSAWNWHVKHPHGYNSI